jgi:hypothetical protein
MRCGNHDCECMKCTECGEQHENCVCQLIKDTQDYLSESATWGDDGAHRDLLYKWLRSKGT